MADSDSVPLSVRVPSWVREGIEGQRRSDESLSDATRRVLQGALSGGEGSELRARLESLEAEVSDLGQNLKRATALILANSAQVDPAEALRLVERELR